MTSFRLGSIIALLIAVPGVIQTRAFCITNYAAPRCCSSPSKSTANMALEMSKQTDAVTLIASVVAASILAFHSSAAVAVEPPAVMFEATPSVVLQETHGYSSSSIEISESVKTLDFSLPSYDKISDANSGSANVDGLEIDPNAAEKKEVKAREKSAPRAKAAPRERSAPKEKLTFNERPAFRERSAPSTAAPDPEKAAREAKFREEKLAAKAAAENAKKEERLAKIAADDAKKEALMQESKDEKLKIIDMDMPSYGSSAPAKKSVFSL